MTLKEILHDYGIDLAIIVAGVMGGFVAMSSKKGVGFWGKVASVVSGGAVANYLTPLIADWLDWSNSSRYGLAFLLGFMGLKAVELIIIKFKDNLNIDEDDKEV